MEEEKEWQFWPQWMQDFIDAIGVPEPDPMWTTPISEMATGDFFCMLALLILIGANMVNKRNGRK